MKKKGRVFLLDDEELIVAVLSKTLRAENYEVFSENECEGVVQKIKDLNPDVVLLDIRMPTRSGIEILEEIKHSGINTQVVMLTADDTAETAVKAMKLGAADYLTKPFNTDEVKIVIGNIIEKANLRQEVDYLRKAYSEVFEKDIVGESEAIKELLAKIEKIAQARVSNILITGESGTGKEVMARHIHNMMFGANSEIANGELLLFRLIVRRCPKPCWKASFLAMKKDRSPMPNPKERGCLNWPKAGYCCWMKSVT